MEKLALHNNGQWDLEKAEKEGNQKDALGISTGKIKFNPESTQRQFEHYVEERADHMCSTGYVKGEPEDFKWYFDPNYSIEKLVELKGSKEDWKTWMRTELHEWVHDHGPKERAGHFDKWAKNPAAKPLIVIEGTDGHPHLIDGHHRCAMAIIKGMKTVPALCGIRKPK